MSIDRWASATSQPPRAGDCGTCGAGAEHQRLFNALSKRPVWRCTRCHATTEVALPWEPNAVPEGRREGHLAIDTLAIHAPFFAPLDREAMYRILRPYFAAGWCVRDVRHAMDYRPDGSLHYDAGIAWSRGEPPDRALSRLLARLRTWRWGDVDSADGLDIMAGGYTAMITAMRARADAQRAQQIARRAEWNRQQVHAQTATERDASAGARRVARVAAVLGRQRRSEGETRAAQHMAAQIAQAREASQAWRALLGDIGEPDPT